MSILVGTIFADTKMFSRTHLLIERELEQLRLDQPWGIDVWPLNDDSLFELVAKIRGPRDSPWEDGIFKLYIKFDEHFNYRPPSIYFQTIPFHPNVDVNTGRPCIDFLDDFEKWNKDYTLTAILTTLQVLLSNPVLKNAVNMDAVQMIHSSPRSYHHMIHECVNASQRIDAGESPQIRMADSKVRFAANDKDGVRNGTAPSQTGSVMVSKLSFDDYHSTWCGIATSKTKPTDVNPLLESIRGKENLQEIHLGLPREEVDEQMKKQMEDHKVLMYGRINFKAKPGQETARQAKLAQLERMKKIYLPPRQSPLPPGQEINLENTLPELQDKEDTKGLEKEGDDLINWTNNLDSNAIDAM